MDLTDRSTHFEFGQNWADYSRLIDERRLKAAVESVGALVGDVRGKTFLDIGSGSGLFSLAALQLGVAKLMAVDIDENSVATTRSVLSSQDGGTPWTAELVSVFKLSPEIHGTFDIVYSWGVLHHTGDMWEAIRKAAQMVKPGGTFAFALYEKTPVCELWKKEKKFYTNASPVAQRIIQRIYSSAYFTGLLLTARNPFKKDYDRGMEGKNDLHDWLGGYPYESTTKEEVRNFMSKQGFEMVDERPVKIHALGVLGSGCSEYVYRRRG